MCSAQLSWLAALGQSPQRCELRPAPGSEAAAERLFAQAGELAAQSRVEADDRRLQLVAGLRTRPLAAAPLGQEQPQPLARGSCPRQRQPLAGEQSPCRPLGVEQVVLARAPAPLRPFALVDEQALR